MSTPKTKEVNKENYGKCCCTGNNFGRKVGRPALATIQNVHGNQSVKTKASTSNTKLLGSAIKGRPLIKSTSSLPDNVRPKIVPSSQKENNSKTPIKPKLVSNLGKGSSTVQRKLSIRTPVKLTTLKVTPNAPVKAKTPTEDLKKRKLKITPISKVKNIDLSRIKPRVDTWLTNSAKSVKKPTSTALKTISSLNTSKARRSASTSTLSNVASNAVSSSNEHSTKRMSSTLASSTSTNPESTIKSSNRSDSGFGDSNTSDSSMFVDAQGNKQSISVFLEECSKKIQAADQIFGAAKEVGRNDLKTPPSINISEAVTLPDEKFFSISQESTVESVLKNVAVVRDTSIVVDDEEKSFIDGLKFFDEMDKNVCSTIKTKSVKSPFEHTIPVTRKSSGNLSRKPAVKTTLKRRSSRLNQDTSFPLLYVPDYFEDLIQYCKQHKDNLIPNSRLVELFVDKRARTLTVNWLHQVAEYFLPQFDLVYYAAVRLFDYAVIQLKMRRSHYQLAAIVSLKMAVKFLDSVGSDGLKVSKMFSLCKGKFSTKEMLEMEIRIFTAIGFNFRIVDPIDFMHYYLKKDGFENNEDLIQTTCFILECATLFHNFCSTDSLLLAGIALYMAQEYLSDCQLNQLKMDFIFYQSSTIQSYIDSLKNNVKTAIMEKYHPAEKYSNTDVLCYINKF